MVQETGLYETYVKRILDILLSIMALFLFWWLFGIIAVLVRIKLGSPVVFVQKRPGRIDCKTGQERIFNLYKFRTMTDEKDAEGNLLPDEHRLTKFGKTLRSLSLDELPEIWNILRGDMSIIGPRPQLVRDMVFMTKEQRKRHRVRPGLSGLAQIRGRNTISWDKKLGADLEYIEKITFRDDLKIVVLTIGKVFRREGIHADGMETAEDYGDYLLRERKIGMQEYEEKQEEARYLIETAGI